MMQGWSAPPPSRPQAYSVTCPEGHRLQGQRTEGYQALRCPTCGEGIFVLPRSPLPEPPTPASPARSQVAAAIEAFPEDEPLILTDPPASLGDQYLPESDVNLPEVEIDWVDEVVPETLSSSRVATEASKQEATPTPRKPRAKPSKPRPIERVEPAVPVIVRPTLAEWTSAHRNGLLVAAVLTLVVGAVAVRYRRQRLEDYPRIAEFGRTEGMKKLDAGEFHAAKKILGDAAVAVEGLGGRFEGADSIRQGALEAAIFADLAPAGIDEIIEKAATTDPKSWASSFAALYKGRSIILDPPIAEAADRSKPGSVYKVSYPLYFGRGIRPEGRGRIDLTGFRLLELATPVAGDQKPFGARFASVELDVQANEWVVTFEPGSGVYITHPKALEAINWSPAESVEEPGP